MLQSAFAPGHNSPSGEPIDLAHERPTRIGPVTVEPALRRISSGGRSKILEPKVMQVLVALMREPGAILSRDDLHELCWNGSIVGDASINRVISLLRSSLREIAGDSVVIDTVPKVGYRILSQEEDATKEETRTTRSIPWASWRRIWALLAALGTVLVGLVAAVSWYSTEQAAREYRVAMLPLQSAASNEDFFVNGLAEEIRRELARNGNVQVANSSSARRYADAGIRPSAIGRRLNVDAVISGQVEHKGDTVGLQIRLYGIDDKEPLLSKSYRATTGSALGLPTRIASDIRNALGMESIAAGGHRNIKPGNFAVYLVAQGMLRTRDVDQVAAAANLLRTVTASDPRFAEGWAALAKAIFLGGGRTGQSSWNDTLDDAREMSRRALRLEPESAEALAVAGLLAEDPSDSERYLARAVATDPGNAEAWLWLGISRTILGDEMAGLRCYERVLAIDPLWSRAQSAPETAAAMGMIEKADRLDRIILTAAVDDWQVQLTRARMARRHGDWSEFLRLGRLAALGAPSTERLQIDRDIMIGRAFLGLDVAQLRSEPVWMLGYHLVRGKLPSAAQLKAMGVDATAFFATPTGSAVSPALFLRSGRQSEYLAAYDELYASPEEFISKSQSMYADGIMAHTPYLVLAMRGAGRVKEAAQLTNHVISGYRRHRSKNVDLLVAQAKLNAVLGKSAQATKLLTKARSMGWPDTASLNLIPAVGPIAEDPAYASLLDNPRFRRFESQVETDRAREGREAEAASEM